MARFITAVLLTSATVASSFGQNYSVSTFAGSELAPHDVPGISAGLGPIRGVAVDVARNVYMSLYLYNSIVRLDATTGILTLVAGNGTYGFNGDSGTAIDAQLNAPRGLAVDMAGNIFIADSLNHRIRRISGGVISTVAGNGVSGYSGDNGPAVDAQLNHPVDVAVDATGNLYIADSYNGRIRKVSKGLITTVAGTDSCCFSGDGGPAISAQLSNPSGVAVDSAGNLYITDTGNLRIRKVANGVITTLAGNGMAGSGGDGGPATAAQFGGGHYDDDDPNVTPFGAIGVAVDSAGNVYIADTLNNRIRRVARGVITTVAGDGTLNAGAVPRTPLSGPHSVAVDSAGNLYIADTYNNRIRQVSEGVITTVAGNGSLRYGSDNAPASNAQLWDPYGVAVDSAGTVYIADTLNNRIRKVSRGVITTVAGNGAPAPDRCCESGTFGGDNGPAIDAQLSAPICVAVDSAGDLYIADVNNSRIRKVSKGVITTVPGSVGFTPLAVAVDNAGDVYIAVRENRIVKVSKGVVSNVAGNGTYGSSGDGGPAVAAQVGSPTSVAVDSAGDVYFSDAGATGQGYLPNAGCIRKVSNGVITTVAGGNAVAVDGADNIYISDEPLNLIRKISSGIMTAVPVSPALTFRSWQIAVDPAGRIYGQDSLRQRILVLTPAGTAATSSVSIDAVRNGASNLPLPIARGEIVILAGSGLGPPQFTSARPGSDGIYAMQLGGTSVQFDGMPAPVLYTSATRVAAVVPYGVTGSIAELRVTYQGQTNSPATFAVAASAPGVFSADSTGKGQAAAVNENGSVNSVSTPAPPGSVISFFVTGVGQTSPQGVDGKTAMAPYPKPLLPVSVTIGDWPETQTISGEQLQYFGAVPGEIAGIMQINVRVPAGITPGSAVPVWISVGSRVSQPGITIAVSGR